MREQELQALSYLKFLNPDESQKFGAPFELEPKMIANADDCIACLSAFVDCGIWPGYLFQRGDIWSIYIKSLAEERFWKAITLVMTIGGPGDLISYLRACYKFGYQVIPDQEYDILERFYITAFPALSYLDETTGDDLITTPIVKEAIKLSSLKGARDAAPKRIPEGSYASLNAEKSTSVKPVRSAAEAYEYLKSVKELQPATHWSLKIDGFNTKCLFNSDGSGLEVAVSRGRAADGWDYTEAVNRVLQVHDIDTKLLNGKITGEAVVDTGALEILRLKYPGKEYKTPKSTAGAMLRAPKLFDLDDYKYLKFYPFDMDGVKKDIAFDKFKQAGFVTPPEFRCRYEDIPLDSIEVFSDWLEQTVMDPFWDQSCELSIGSDGVVLQLLTDIENDRADKYSDLNIAMKFSHWTEAEYSSRVTKILFEQRRVEMSVVLEIEPVTTRDLNIATRVSVGSPAILVNDGVRIGDTIRFARKSEAINIYLGKAVKSS